MYMIIVYELTQSNNSVAEPIECGKVSKKINSNILLPSVITIEKVHDYMYFMFFFKFCDFANALVLFLVFSTLKYSILQSGPNIMN